MESNNLLAGKVVPSPLLNMFLKATVLVVLLSNVIVSNINQTLLQGNLFPTLAASSQKRVFFARFFEVLVKVDEIKIKYGGVL